MGSFFGPPIRVGIPIGVGAGFGKPSGGAPVSAEYQRQIPGGQFINQTSDDQAQIPGGQYVNGQ